MRIDARTESRRTPRAARGAILGAAVVLLGLLTVSCGIIESAAEKAAEEAVEKAIEADSGEDIELDFGSGGFNIETDEGSMSFDTETGQFVLVDENGEVITADIDIEGDGIKIKSSEGDVSFDSETGEFTLTDNDGEVITGTVNTDNGVEFKTSKGDLTFDATTGEFLATDTDGNTVLDGELSEEDGELSFEITEDGDTTSVSIGQGDWPDDIIARFPQVEDLGTIQTTSGTDALTQATFLAPADFDEVKDFYLDELDDWSIDSTFEQADFALFEATKDPYLVVVSIQNDGDKTFVSMQLTETL